jgi:septal ring factor EnvC (AmiA/AmiB activator)
MKKELFLKIWGKRILCAILFCSALGGQGEASAISTPAVKGDPIKEIESDLNREKQKFEEFDAHERDLLAEISGLEQQVAIQKKALEDSKKKIQETKTSIKDLEEKLSQVQQLTRHAEDRVAKRLVALYKHARRGYFRILANAQDLDQFGQRLVYLRSIMEEDRKVIVRMDEEQRRQRKEIVQIREALREKENTQKEEKARFSSLTKDLEIKAVHLMKIHKEKEFYETAVRELEIAAKNLSQELVRIEKDAYETPQSSRFEDSRGHLTLPLEGEIVKWGGRSGSAKGGLHK